MAKHQHVTFTSGSDVLKHAIEYLAGICEALEVLRSGQHGERVKMLLTSVETEQRNLLGSLERLREDASEKVLATFAQYTVEMPTEVGLPDEEPLTTLGLIQWLEERNRHLQKLFRELSEKGDAQESDETFGAIADQVEAHERRLSKEYQSTEGL